MLICRQEARPRELWPLWLRHPMLYRRGWRDCAFELRTGFANGRPCEVWYRELRKPSNDDYRTWIIADLTVPK